MTKMTTDQAPALKLHEDAVEAAWDVMPEYAEDITKATLAAAIRAYLAELARAGWKVVPREATEEMVNAGTDVDWVGEAEGRDGLSIMPHETDDWAAYEKLPEGSDVPKKTLPGIWPTMHDAAPPWPPVNQSET